MQLLRRANPSRSQSIRTVSESTWTPEQSTCAKPQPNPRFLRGLAELVGQFEPEELAAHRQGLLCLINEASESETTFDAHTPDVVIQRAIGQLASRPNI